ncbi:MAG: 2-oxo acid dehydrogenase subunit E2 [Oscillospiraceae bacterium]|nr:2-oxo acid dehydrogenase subunit E2 [Oscillospiraceae bacterium]
MSKIRAFWNRYPYCWVLPLYIFMPVWYFTLQLIGPASHAVWMPLDDVIPFNEWFIIPYVEWYLFVFGTLFWMMLTRSRERFLRQVILLYGGMLVCLIIQSVWPTHIDFRPEILPRNNFLTWIVGLIYGADNPINVFPSIHCYNALAIALGITLSGNPSRGKPSRGDPSRWQPLWVALAWANSLLICASTVYIKQHAVWDFVGAVAVILPMYVIAYKIQWPFLKTGGVLMERKKRWGDRKDGWRLRGLDPMFQLMPYVMEKRNESVVYFTNDIDITGTEKFMRELRRSSYPGLSYTHLFFAAAVRTFALNPRMNRFVSGKRMYARNTIRLSITVKGAMTAESPEYNISCDFDPRNSLLDTAAALDAKLAEVKNTENATNDADQLTKTIMAFPKFIVGIIKRAVFYLDKKGRLPKDFSDSTPFFASAYMVNNGSLGINSVHHHLYELGTTSIFLSIGRKENRYVPGPTGEIKAKKIMTVRATIDERICDGFHYAKGINEMQDILEHPAVLLERYEGELPEDNEINKKKKK